jgi:hypothetical protein
VALGLQAGHIQERARRPHPCREWGQEARLGHGQALAYRRPRASEGRFSGSGEQASRTEEACTMTTPRISVGSVVLWDQCRPGAHL